MQPAGGSRRESNQLDPAPWALPPTALVVALQALAIDQVCDPRDRPDILIRPTTAPANHAWLRHRGIRVRIARRGIESSTRLGRHRWRVERSLSWLSCWRRLQVRWDRDAGRWFGLVLLACAVVCFNRLWSAEGSEAACQPVTAGMMVWPIRSWASSRCCWASLVMTTTRSRSGTTRMRWPPMPTAAKLGCKSTLVVHHP
jgi:hypothetical protein